MVSGWDVLLGEQELGEVVIVIDEEYGHQAPTIAEFLLDRGAQVDLVTRQETIGTFLGATTRPPLLSRLFGKGGQLFAHLVLHRAAVAESFDLFAASHTRHPCRSRYS